jgi:hypothetical protein
MTSAGFGEVTDVASTVINLNPTDNNNIIVTPVDPNNGNQNNTNNNNTNNNNTNNNNNPIGGDSSTGGSNSKTGMIVGIVVGATSVVILAILSSVCYMRKKVKISNLSSM